MKNGVCPSGHLLLGHLPAFLKDPLGFLTHCARSYGAVVPLRLLHQPAFLLLDASDVERVLVTEQSRFIKPSWLRTSAVRRLLGDGLVTSDGGAWRRQRQTCQPAFHPRRMDAYGTSISDLAERMMEKWQPGQTRDLQREMMHLTLEIVAETLLDVETAGWTEATGASMDTLMARFTAGRNLFGMLPWPPAPREKQAVRQIDRTVDLLICHHAAGRSDREGASGIPAGEIEGKPESEAAGTPEDLLSLLRGAVNEGGQERSERQLREQVKTFLGAGYESSALVLTWAFLLLARHPEVETELEAELEAVLGDRSPTRADLPQLPYTQAIVKETMRLYPPLWMTGRQAAHSCEIGGFRVPRGALMMTSQWAVQRHPCYFDRPDAFRPERWEGAETAGLPRFAYFPFGGGPRVCIAQSFALMETSLLLAAIARRFRLELPPGQEIQPWASMTLRPPIGIRVQLKRRGRATT